MIKFAVSRPPVRRQAIKAGLGLLNWQADPMLKGYKLRIDPDMIKTAARVLEPPEVLFAKNITAKPMYSGRWDLRGKVFLRPNHVPLTSWGICVLNGRGGRPSVSQEQLSAFTNSFIKLYQGHGGNVVERNPIVTANIASVPDALATCFQSAGDKAKLRPQMIMVILPEKSSDLYQRVKKNCDCRFGVMSQCVQSANVVKNQPQYCSNVLMKFNCKLGGTTSALKAVFLKPLYIIYLLTCDIANSILHCTNYDHRGGCFSCSARPRTSIYGGDDRFA